MPSCWIEVGDSMLTGPELAWDMTKEVVLWLNGGLEFGVRNHMFVRNIPCRGVTRLC